MGIWKSLSIAGFVAIVQILLGCDLQSSSMRRIAIDVRNESGVRLKDFRVVGEGFPGEMGDMVIGGTSLMDYGTVAIDNEFEVRWQDADGGPQIRKLTLPAKFAEEKRSRLVIQINPGGEVQVSAIRRR